MEKAHGRSLALSPASPSRIRVAPHGRLQQQGIPELIEWHLPPADRAKYVGVYALGLPNGPRDFTIAEDGSLLTAQLAGQSANPILFYGNNTFGMKFDPALRLIFEVEGGRAVKVVLLQNGGRYEGMRK